MKPNRESSSLPGLAFLFFRSNSNRCPKNSILTDEKCDMQQKKYADLQLFHRQPRLTDREQNNNNNPKNDIVL